MYNNKTKLKLALRLISEALPAFNYAFNPENKHKQTVWEEDWCERAEKLLKLGVEKPIKSFDREFKFLSNFYLCEIKYSNLVYPSVEHAYQAAKTFDTTDKFNILRATTPAEAKKLGAKVRLRSDWEDIKLDLMYELLTIKFQNPKLKNLLLQTGDAHLEEGNYWNDTFWGVVNNVGQNHLGKLLMRIRKQLQEETLG